MKDMKRLRFRAAACLAAALTLLTMMASAVQLGYDGPVDSVTGEPSESGSIDAYSDQVRVSENVYYDRNRMGYLYTAAGNAQVLSSVVDGMVVQDVVRLEPDEGLSLTLYKDGTAMEDVDLTHINEIGDYVVQVTTGSGQTQRVLSFTIVGNATGRLTGYTMPSGFVITDATRDGEATPWDRFYIGFTEEGLYEVTYRCPRNGLDYKLNVLIDFTPPVLALEAVENGRARGPVSLEDLEEGAYISVYYNDRQIPYQQVLEDSGDYHVLVMDQAGNLSEYYFTILIYFDLNSLVFMAMVVGVLAAVGIYLWLSRKRLKIR